MALNDMINTDGTGTGLSLKGARLLNLVLLEDGTIAAHDGLKWTPVRMGAGTVESVADSTARTALTPDAGDIVIQTDSGAFYVYDGSAWQIVPTSSLTVQDVGGGSQTDVNTLNFEVPGFAAAADGTGQATISRLAAVAVSAQTSLAVWRKYIVDAGSGGGYNLVVPASPTAGDEIELVWKAGTLSTNPIVIKASDGTTTLFTCNTDGTLGTLVYTGAAWKLHKKLYV